MAWGGSYEVRAWRESTLRSWCERVNYENEKVSHRVSVAQPDDSCRPTQFFMRASPINSYTVDFRRRLAFGADGTERPSFGASKLEVYRELKLSGIEGI